MRRESVADGRDLEVVIFKLFESSGWKRKKGKKNEVRFTRRQRGGFFMGAEDKYVVVEGRESQESRSV